MSYTENVSIEKCLDVVPNKFDLTIYAMNRAKELLAGAEPMVSNNKTAKKQINQALLEIQENKIDIAELRDRIENNILNNNNFLKDTKQDEDDMGDKKDLSADSLDDLDDSTVDSNFDDLGDDTDLDDDSEPDKM